MKKAIALTLMLVLLIHLTACTSSNITDLMQGINAGVLSVSPDIDAGTSAAADFGIQLFKRAAAADNNALISPLSILSALAMTANGAQGLTLEQLENVFGMSLTDLNEYLYYYTESLPQGDAYRLHLANSVWITEDSRFTANGDFLSANARYYNAGIFSAPFDNSTLNGINKWVKNQTDGMIPSVLDEINPSAVMYLVSALAFEAEWQSIYYKHQVHDGIFTTESGAKQDAELMYSDEHLYLEDDFATGFMKFYDDSSYAFVALLPKEGVTIADYAASLDGARLLQLLKDARNTTVNAAIPKFETESAFEMADILEQLGVTDAFDVHAADFSGLGSSEAGNIYIERVVHKTFISVGEKGTKAGSATLVEMADGAAPVMDEIKEVYLDRPFVYLLVDSKNHLPLFIGTVTDLEN